MMTNGRSRLMPHSPLGYLIAAAIIVVVLVGGWLFVTQVVIPAGYWDGGDYKGQPVYDTFGNMTYAAHLQLEKCGVSDRDFDQMRQSSQGQTTYFGPNAETKGTVTWYAQVPGVYVVNCVLASEWTPTPTLTPTPAVTRPATPAATSESSQVQIVSIDGVGDIANEVITIRNVSDTAVDLGDWVLSDDQGGRVFTLPSARLFPSTQIMIYSRAGQNSPIALYWGSTNALWGDYSGEVLLKDADGNIQSVYTLPQP